MMGKLWQKLQAAFLWLATHPWPIVASLGAAIAYLLLRSEPKPGKAEVLVARELGRVDVARGHAQRLEPVIEAKEREIERTEERLERLEKPVPTEDMSDAEFADLLNSRGL